MTRRKYMETSAGRAWHIIREESWARHIVTSMCGITMSREDTLVTGTRYYDKPICKNCLKLTRKIESLEGEEH